MEKGRLRHLGKSMSKYRRWGHGVLNKHGNLRITYMVAASAKEYSSGYLQCRSIARVCED